MLWLSKHYYNGSRRIATQTGTPSWLPSGTIFEQGTGSEKKAVPLQRTEKNDLKERFHVQENIHLNEGYY